MTGQEIGIILAAIGILFTGMIGAFVKLLAEIRKMQNGEMDKRFTAFGQTIGLELKDALEPISHAQKEILKAVRGAPKCQYTGNERRVSEDT